MNVFFVYVQKNLFCVGCMLPREVNIVDSLFLIFVCVN